MKQERCSECDNYVPMNKMFTHRGHLICESCLEKKIMNDDTVRSDEILRHRDPTVCANCGRDGGSEHLEALSGLPTCRACTAYFRNRPFPAWLKVALVVLVVVVGLHMVQGRRFWLAYHEIRQARQTEDFHASLALLASAAARVPENSELQSFGDLFKGLCLIQENRCEEALFHLERSRGALPPEFGVDGLIGIAKSGAAFDRGDYDEFLDTALEMRHQYPDDGLSWAYAASAYACKHVVTGDAVYYKNALTCLDSARVKSPDDPTIREYEQRIQYRLAAKEIISTEEFYRRFPNGWEKGDR